MPHACKDCGTPIHQRGDRWVTDERHADAPAFSGQERRVAAPPQTEPPKTEPPKQETPPKREHLLHRRIGPAPKQPPT